jgi:hypothetical protein
MYKAKYNKYSRKERTVFIITTMTIDINTLRENEQKEKSTPRKYSINLYDNYFPQTHWIFFIYLNI